MVSEYELCIIDFIISMVIWYRILAKVNNLILQSETIYIDETRWLYGIIHWLN